MKFTTIKTLLIYSLCLSVMSCAGKKESESEIASKIEVKLKPENTTVLPTALNNTVAFTTCLEGGVAAPRVRFPEITIAWSGTERLLPLLLQVRMEDSRLKSVYTAVMAPSGSLATIAHLFGRRTAVDQNGTVVMNDEIPGFSGAPNTAPTIYSNKDPVTGVCYPDFGGLPATTEPISGSNTLKIRMQFKLSGVVESSSGEQMPFTKSFDGYVTYFDGSVPPTP